MYLSIYLFNTSSGIGILKLRRGSNKICNWRNSSNLYKNTFYSFKTDWSLCSETNKN